MDMDQALDVFFAESRDLLEQMEESLLCLESSPEDEEAINSLFRAAHTIKGSAGIFGLDDVVTFTHAVENTLEQVRASELRMDEELSALLLECRDRIAEMIERIAANETADPAEGEQQKVLRERLERYLAQGKALPATRSEREGQVEAIHPETRVRNENWHISLRFDENVLRNGMDPIAFIRYLRKLGEIVSIFTICDQIPPAADMDPESCYLGFEIDFDSEADKAEIEAVFDFVREDCVLHILAPHSRIIEYLAMINDHSGSDERLGEILVQVGAITQRELEQGLAIQQASDAEQRAQIGEILVEQDAVQPEVVDAALEKQRQGREARGKERSFLRVQAEKLDQLIDLVGELVIASDSINLHAMRLEDEGLYESASLVGRLVSEVRDSALTLRMVQVGETFNRFHRVVRDISRELDKEIRLEINGGETELDKSVVEKIADPLMHLVRNAMDHGIETPSLRREKGKPTTGTLRLNAYHDSGSIVIEVEDDGAGIDTDKVRMRAVERGLIAPEQILGEQEICNLIFEPGFSTADAVTNLSGRGVGMDVVRRNIESLRGTVDMENRRGQGTTARIRLPLTLAIIDAFLMGVGTSGYVVPLDAVIECVEMDARMRRDARGNDYITLRDEILPFIRLRDMFDISGDRPALEHVVVVQFGNERAGLVVDSLLGEFQAVIKPVATIFGGLRGIGGTTILGSGEVALILDVTALVHHALARHARGFEKRDDVPMQVH